MEEIDNPEVIALKELCDKVGGFKALAAAISANDQSIYQILAGVSLPSGRKKGVGPTLRDKLNKHYPGWNTKTIAPVVDESIRVTLSHFATLLQSIPPESRDAASYAAVQALIAHLPMMKPQSSPEPQKAGRSGK